MQSNEPSSQNDYLGSYRGSAKSGSPSVKIGCVKTFVRVTDCLCDDLCDCNPRHFAIVKRFPTRMPFLIENSRTPVSFMFECTDDRIEAISVETIQSVCFATDVKRVEGISVRYVSEHVNDAETE